MDFGYKTFKDYKIIGEKFLRDNPYGITTLPTNIEVLITKAGYAIETEANLYTQYSVKGLVVKNTTKPDSYKILIDQFHYENHEFSSKFTLAEELAHIILHSDLYAKVNTLDDFISEYCSFSEENYKFFEQQAKSVASHLLLPQQAFEEYIFEWVEQNIQELIYQNFGCKEDLSFYIAQNVSKYLELTSSVINIAILRRYPDLIIDKILEKNPELLK